MTIWYEIHFGAPFRYRVKAVIVNGAFALYLLRRFETMTGKDRILAVLRGEPTDVLPFVPRLDIWYNANSKAGTLPERYKNASLRDIADDLGWGCHAIIPNFADFRGDDGDLDVGLGLYDLKCNPYRIILHNVKRTWVRDPSAGTLSVEYDTPKGKLRTKVVYTQSMRDAGITLYVIREHAVKTMDDYPAMAFLLNNAEVVPAYDDYCRFREEYVGDRGVAVCLSAMFASPGHYLIKELMRLDDFYYEMADNPDEMDAFVEEIRPFWSRLFQCAVNSPAEVILSGANYDSSITSPSMFRRYITDELKQQSSLLHAQGRFLATHTDGENTGLMEEYKKAGIDVSDSFCPSPMTRVSLAEARSIFAGSGITIWGGIPSIAVLEDVMSDRDFYVLVDRTMQDIGRGDHILFSVADTVPPAAKFDRLLHISRMCREFGPVVP